MTVQACSVCKDTCSLLSIPMECQMPCLITYSCNLEIGITQRDFDAKVRVLFYDVTDPVLKWAEFEQENEEIVQQFVDVSVIFTELLTKFSIKRTRRKRLQLPFLTHILCAGWHLSPQPGSWWNVAHWAAPLWMSVRLGGALTASSTPHRSWRSGTVQGLVLSCLQQRGSGSLAELCSVVLTTRVGYPGRLRTQLSLGARAWYIASAPLPIPLLW